MELQSRAPVQAAIDFGISNTDAVAYVEGEWRRWTRPYAHLPDSELVRAILGDGGVDLDALSRLAVTGGRHRLLPQRIGACEIVGVNELTAIGRGGQALAGGEVTGWQGDKVTRPSHPVTLSPCHPVTQSPLLVVSAGSGTAMVAAHGASYTHATGTAVGGGTMLGLARLILGTTDPLEIDKLASEGNPNGADLSLADVITGSIGSLPAEATAVNFGRLARLESAVTRADLAAALVTMVGQVVGLLAIQAARAQQIERIVVIGHLVDMPSMCRVLASVGQYYATSWELPADAGYATAMGALLHVYGDIA